MHSSYMKKAYAENMTGGGSEQRISFRVLTRCISWKSYHLPMHQEGGK